MFASDGPPGAVKLVGTLGGFVFDELRVVTGQLAPPEPEPTDCFRELGEHQEEGDCPRSRLSFASQSAGYADHVDWVREQQH